MSKNTFKHAGKQSRRQVRNHLGRYAGRQVGRQAGRQARIHICKMHVVYVQVYRYRCVVKRACKRSRKWVIKERENRCAIMQARRLECMHIKCMYSGMLECRPGFKQAVE